MDLRDKALIALLIIGLADSVYLASVYAGAAPLYCSVSNIINCQKVESSSYSVVLGIPLAYGGIAWFTIAITLFLFRKNGMVRKLASIWYVLGIGAAAYSLLSMYNVGAICEYCLVSDAIFVAIGVLELGRRG